MRMSKWCKDSGMTRKEYNEYKASVEKQALEIFNKASQLHAIDSGIYYDIKEILPSEESQERTFVINELRELGMEFINDCTMYRI